MLVHQLKEECTLFANFTAHIRNYSFKLMVKRKSAGQSRKLGNQSIIMLNLEKHTSQNSSWLASIIALKKVNTLFRFHFFCLKICLQASAAQIKTLSNTPSRHLYVLKMGKAAIKHSRCPFMLDNHVDQSKMHPQIDYFFGLVTNAVVFSKILDQQK